MTGCGHSGSKVTAALDDLYGVLTKSINELSRNKPASPAYKTFFKDQGYMSYVL